MSSEQPNPVYLNALVVDDSAAMRDNVVKILEMLMCFEIRQAHNGADALRHLHQRKFDLVVTDINMPQVDGLKLVELIRKHPQHRDVPVIIMTTESAAEDKARAMRLGANMYLMKPANAGELTQAVRALCHVG